MVVNIAGAQIFAVVALATLARRKHAVPPPTARIAVAALALTPPMMGVVTGDAAGVTWGLLIMALLATLAIVVDVRVTVAVGLAQSIVLAGMFAVSPNWMADSLRSDEVPWALVYLVVAVVPVAVALPRTLRPARL